MEIFCTDRLWNDGEHIKLKAWHNEIAVNVPSNLILMVFLFDSSLSLVSHYFGSFALHSLSWYLSFGSMHVRYVLLLPFGIIYLCVCVTWRIPVSPLLFGCRCSCYCCVVILNIKKIFVARSFCYILICENQLKMIQLERLTECDVCIVYLCSWQWINNEVKSSCGNERVK